MEHFGNFAKVNWGLDNIFNSLFDDGKSLPNHKIQQIGDNVVLALALPGFKKDEVEIEFEGDILTVKNKEQDFTNSLFKVPFENQFKINNNIVDANNINAKMEDGVLVITIPTIKQAKSTKIDVE